MADPHNESPTRLAIVVLVASAIAIMIGLYIDCRFAGNGKVEFCVKAFGPLKQILPHGGND